METEKKKSEKVIPYDKDRALSTVSKFGVKLSTVERWMKDGFMPNKYFEERNIFKVGEKNLLELRIESGLSQGEFVDKFNKTFNTDLTTVSVSTWESGKGNPMKTYQNLLNLFYNKEG